MRIANVSGRAKLVVGESGTCVDVERASGGVFGPDAAALYDRWGEFRQWASSLGDTGPPETFSAGDCGPPCPRPAQVFAVALNYAEHAAETGRSAPEAPLVFAKYVSAFSGPVTEVALPRGNVDWECELVAIISRTAHRIAPGTGWSYVAGLTAGQDLSERVLQRSGPAPQFGLAKSYPGFAPTGPILVTPDELNAPDDLGLGCELNGAVMQDGRTKDMIFPVPELVEYLASVVTLLPGDVIFTGTPPGVGAGRKPPVFIQAGDHLHSWIDGIGELDQRFVSP